MSPNDPLLKLEYYQRQSEARTFYARVSLLVVIFGALAANGWMSQRNYETMIINMDQARLAQAELQEVTQSEIRALREEISGLQAEVASLRAASEARDAEVVASR